MIWITQAKITLLKLYFLPGKAEKKDSINNNKPHLGLLFSRSEQSSRDMVAKLMAGKAIQSRSNERTRSRKRIILDGYKYAHSTSYRLFVFACLGVVEQSSLYWNGLKGFFLLVLCSHRNALFHMSTCPQSHVKKHVIYH
mgnify:CR=1 FL=1